MLRGDPPTALTPFGFTFVGGDCLIPNQDRFHQREGDFNAGRVYLYDPGNGPIEIQNDEHDRVATDVLISTANPWLNLSGGVNGAILSAAGLSMQEELHAYLKREGMSAVPAGTVIESSSGNLPFDCILHAVAIDPCYDSTVALVRQTLVAALELAIKAGAKTISTPTLATGYGPMSIADFGSSVAPLVNEPRFDGLSLTIVVRAREHQSELADSLNSARPQP